MLAAKTESKATGSLNQVQGTVLAVAVGLTTLGVVQVDAPDADIVGMGSPVVFSVHTGVPALSHQLEQFIAAAPELLRATVRVDQVLAVEPDDYAVR